MEQLVSLVVVIAMVVFALKFKPLRKTIGLLLVILGGIANFTIIGMIIGIPMVVIGGILLFI